MVPKDPNDATADLVGGGYLVSFEARTLDDIRAMGANSPEDERKFAAAARVSDINLGLYKTLVQPWVRMGERRHGRLDAADASGTDAIRVLRALQSNVAPFNSMVESVQKNRLPCKRNNPYWQMQKAYSEWMTQSLDAFRDVRDRMQEEWFHAFYGSPVDPGLGGPQGLG